jgi:penicillin amidase
LSIALLLICAGVVGMLKLRASLPQTAGTLSLPGLEKPVRVLRDSHGVPSILASSQHDLYMALGFVHAQDRLFQMDLQRRLGAGRLSEVVGSGAIGTDRLMRTLGIYRHAAASLNAASSEFEAVLDAYSAGINAFLHSGKTLPVEFTVLGYRPDDWTPADTLAIGKLLALQLSGNYRQELLRARLVQTLSSSEIGDLFPEYPRDAPVTLSNLASLTHGLPLEALLAALPFDGSPQRASNNWVVDGAHSVTGKPLLANDPHLDFAAPLVWYLAHLEAPNIDLTGATTPGAPVVVLGHNNRIAWGFTATNADVEDVFVEQVDPVNPGRYVTPQGTAAFEVSEESIMVKGGAPEMLTVRDTRHGPVISNIVADMPPAPVRSVLALQASFLNDDDQSVEAAWRIGLAQDWTGWLNALRLFTAPALNMVFADRDGNIGFKVPGRIPIRKFGNGLGPVSGASGNYDWSGFIPFENLPHAFNPPTGHIATANNKIVPDNYPYLITLDWDAPYRIERIEAWLAKTQKQSMAGSMLLQADTLSLSARELLPLLLIAKPRSPSTAAAIDLLRRWDDRMDPDRPEPLVFSAWVRALNRRLFQPRLGTIYGRYWTASARVTQAVLLNRHSWCGKDGCQAVIESALTDALDDLTARYGGAMEHWRWGEAHWASFDHPLFSKIAVLRAAFDRHPPAGGAADTVNAGGFDVSNGETPFADRHGPGFRAVYDLSDLDNSTFQMALGQSEHVLSPHYDDLLKLWTRFEGINILSNPYGEVLMLLPQLSSATLHASWSATAPCRSTALAPRAVIGLFEDLSQSQSQSQSQSCINGADHVGPREGIVSRLVN